MLTFNQVNATVAFIGHHETAWTINKFSHVARKHQLVEVCLNSLSKIYNLPNIEILVSKYTKHKAHFARNSTFVQVEYRGAQSGKVRASFLVQ